MLPPQLDYLFIAAFTDGTKYYQTRHDVSTLEPLTRSAFYDVLQRLPEVESFTLTNGRNEHTVFLGDGHFKTNGKLITNPHGELTNFRLIYFRRMEVNTFETSNATLATDWRGKKFWLKADSRKAAPKLLSYFIGWQANDHRGKNFQMLLEIAPTGSVAPVILK